MSRAIEYQFVSTDSAEIVADLTAKYEELTGRTLLPSDPDKLFIQWVAGIIIQQRIIVNYAANQNIPSRAVGENLDALGKMIYNVSRPQAKPAECVVRFTISAQQETAIPIPKGTRVTDSSGSLMWATTVDTAVEIGAVFVDAPVICEKEGTVGNGYAPGQINTLVDVDKVLYYSSCSNIETSNSGTERATDNEYYELMRAGLEAFSTAGPKGAYEYHAKAVSTSIADVCAINPIDKPGYVNIFAIMANGEIADDGTKNAILAACNDDKVRPLTDVVEVLDPLVVEFNIELTYYVDRNSQKSAAEIESAIRSAVEEYADWQCKKIGRDINPSRLMWLIKDTGAKRVDIKSPVFVSLRDGSDRLTPQTAHTVLTSAVIVNGGYEDE
ncbi:MAG: baseplate J/gp47 family protein [Oscillospiraceae bacterium]